MTRTRLRTRRDLRGRSSCLDRGWLLLVVLVVGLIGTACRGPEVGQNHDESNHDESNHDESARCAVLESIRTGGWHDRALFPKPTWEDVPALLRAADDETLLTSFPVNPFSSQSQQKCSVGVLALWLVEGLRSGGDFGYPSLNPLLLPRGVQGEDWEAESEKNRAIAATAYREWWKAWSGSPQDREAHDPLEGTGVQWYGKPAPGASR